MAREQELHKGLSDAVVDMDEDLARELAQAVVDEGFDAYEAIDKGLSAGMEEVGRLYEEEEYFIPELLLCSDAMYAGIEILRPHIKKREDSVRHTVVIGVVEGDTHDIGKNLVRIMMEGAGLEVVDLGVDVAPEAFVQTAIDKNCSIIACSSLLTTAMNEMRSVVRLAEESGIREKVKIMVGGAPITESFCREIGADAYTDDAASAARVAVRLLGGA